MSLTLATRSLCPFLYPTAARSVRLLSGSGCSAASRSAPRASSSNSRSGASAARRRFSATASALRPPPASAPDAASSRPAAAPQQWPPSMARPHAAPVSADSVIETAAPAPEETAAAAAMAGAGPSSSATEAGASSSVSSAVAAAAASASACATLSPSSPSAPRSQKSAAAPAEPAAAAAAPSSPAVVEDAGTAEMKPAKAKARASAFKPRKSALTLTPTAVERLSSLLASPSGPKLIRIGVRNKGCAGMSYHLEYVRPEEAGRFDERVKQDGVEVLIDSKALFSIIGSEMDWQEDRLSAKFVFNNPNVTEACGCGESWTTV